MRSSQSHPRTFELGLTQLKIRRVRKCLLMGRGLQPATRINNQIPNETYCFPTERRRRERKRGRGAAHAWKVRVAFSAARKSWFDCHKMNPEQDTRSGFTTRCCLSSWDLNYPCGFGVSGDGECRPDN